MEFYIIIPAHNEDKVIGDTLTSLTMQTLLPKKVIVVNDNSSDLTGHIAEDFVLKYPWIEVLHLKSSNAHLPGTKIINAFYKGYNQLDDHYDVICKFDADLIFPEDYLERLAKHYHNNSKLGMVAGHCYIQKEEQWILENLTRKDHIRGALKAYRKSCFIQIGMLKPSMGWDTIDELLAQFYGWEILTDDTLKVKHLKPTGSSYAKASKYMQGEAMYKMHYGWAITLISAAKLAYKKRSFSLFRDYMIGFFKAYKNKTAYLVTTEQGRYIRKLRWTNMLQKLK